MGSRINLLVRLTSEINFIPQKRFRTRWLSRNPVKVLSENASDLQDGIKNKLNIETQILKAGSQAQIHEVVSKQTDTKRNRLSNVAAERLHKQKASENRLKRELGQLAKEEQNSRRTDPFGLSNLIAEDENIPEKLPEIDMHTFPGSHAYGNCTVSYNSNSTVTKNSMRDQVQALDRNEKPTRNKTEHDPVETCAPKPVGRKGGDEKLRKIMLLTKSKKMREKNNLVAVEGKRLIQDFIDAGATPKMIFFSRQQDIKSICTGQNHIEFHRVPYKQLSLWTDVATSQGVIGLFEISNILRQTPAENSLPITIICDNVRDPGNMGSVLRIAAAAGCEKVILTKGCVDLWDSKVLRSAAGAHGRLQLIEDLSWEVVPEHLPDGCVTFAADSSQLQSHVTPLLYYNKADFHLASHIALIVGGETHGLSSSALALASARLHVPISVGVDSLNTAVAFAIIVFEARRHLTAGT
ncbi:rRNA methyltransferase 3, mitochondrial isoform X1 [Schistocerca serialis cubense]|uniref:rRNA methyltransferase 3, mitochondrial isoform X1 n=2 Tax=Schistocerca TaxID=7008 RepID=UPI00214E3C7D|nr:rRNA methyltransferase 3, mitochondrial isoform X1 [Schistocerca serialis cubense]